MSNAIELNFHYIYLGTYMPIAFTLHLIKVFENVLIVAFMEMNNLEENVKSHVSISKEYPSPGACHSPSTRPATF